jgi:hypothetical protein
MAITRLLLGAKSRGSTARHKFRVQQHGGKDSKEDCNDLKKQKARDHIDLAGSRRARMNLSLKQSRRSSGLFTFVEATLIAVSCWQCCVLVVTCPSGAPGETGWMELGHHERLQVEIFGDVCGGCKSSDKREETPGAARKREGLTYACRDNSSTSGQPRRPMTSLTREVLFLGLVYLERQKK